ETLHHERRTYDADTPSQPRPGRSLEQLEDRLAPATLIITPASGFIDAVAGLNHPTGAMHGLTTAQAHTHGVITWITGASGQEPSHHQPFGLAVRGRRRPPS